MDHKGCVPEEYLDYEVGVGVTFDGYPFTGTASEDVPGQGSTETEYVDGEIHGVTTWWGTDGVLVARQWFYKGASHGARLEYGPTGEVVRRIEYEYGVAVKEYVTDSNGPRSVVKYLYAYELEWVEKYRHELGWPALG